MATKKKAVPSRTAAGKKGGADAPVPKERKLLERPKPTEAYEKAVREFGAALQLLHAGSYAAALERFKSIEAASGDEPVLADRARSHIAVCSRKLSPPPSDPTDPEQCYNLAVVRSNEGLLDEAARLLDRAVAHKPEQTAFLYARASVRALQGNAEASAADLKRAVALEPKLRYQVANDPDFERVRDEAAIIDVIEPTPAGA